MIVTRRKALGFHWVVVTISNKHQLCICNFNYSSKEHILLTTLRGLLSTKYQPVNDHNPFLGFDAYTETKEQDAPIPILTSSTFGFMTRVILCVLANHKIWPYLVWAKSNCGTCSFNFLNVAN